MALKLNTLQRKIKIGHVIAMALILLVGVFSYLFFTRSADAAIATTTYTFEDDTVGTEPADILSMQGFFEVVDSPTLGKSLQLLHDVNGDTIPAAVFELGNLSYLNQEYQQVSWRHAYSDSNNISGFTLRAQGWGTATSENYPPYISRAGYMFQVDVPNNTANIYLIGSSSPDVLLESYSLTAQGLNTARSYRATADGSTLTFEWSANGSSWTTLGSVSDTTYSSGLVQFVDGFGGTDGAQVIDDISYSYTVPDPPGAPTSMYAENQGSQNVYLSWTAPASDGGAEITSYPIEFKPTAGSVWATVSPSNIVSYGQTQKQITGLTTGTSYDFRVKARNSAGDGPFGSVVSATPATYPGAPTGLTATPGNAQVALSWTAPADNGGSAMTDYYVYYRQTGATPWTYFYDPVSPTTTSTVTGLTNGTSYDFQVVPFNSIGSGPASAAAVATPRTVPGAPTAVSGVAGNGQVTVSFSAPASNGGSAITGYTVTSTPGGITATGSGSPITVTGLTNGTAYTFRVTATNIAGTGSASTASASVTPRTVPGAPTGVSAVAGNGQATVSFSAPASNGGSAITGYTVTSSPGGITATGSSSPIVVTGLANGTAYTFTVRATNIAGSGTASGSSSAVTPATVPSAPTGFSTTRGNGQVALVWSAPSSGGAAITDYKVEYKTSAASTWNVFAHSASTTPALTVTGLTNGTSYDFRVSGINSVGNGLVSSVATATPATVPAQPAVTTTAALLGMTLSWAAPDDGGAAILGYVIEYKKDVDSTWIIYSEVADTVTSVTVPELTPDVLYDFRVAAFNDIDTGPYSVVESDTPLGVPTTVSAGGEVLANGDVLSSLPTFTGTANPGSTITVTVHSDPVVCTTTADASGDWSCTLPTSLPAGTHTVYVSVTPAGGGAATEYGPYTVTVAGQVITPNTGSEPVSFFNYVIAAVVGSIAVVVTLVLYVYRRSRIKA